MIDGRRTLPARVTVRGTRAVGRDVHTSLEIVLREGRNRQVRRMCEAVGHPVVTLKRTRIGAITPRGLKPGDIRDLRREEIQALLKTKGERVKG